MKKENKPNVLFIKMYHCVPAYKQNDWDTTRGVSCCCLHWKKSPALQFVWMCWGLECMTTTTTTFKTKPSIITTSQAISKQRNYGNYSVGRVSRCYFAHTASITRSVLYQTIYYFPLFTFVHLFIYCIFKRIYSMQNLNTWNDYCFLRKQTKKKWKICHKSRAQYFMLDNQPSNE